MTNAGSGRGERAFMVGRVAAFSCWFASCGSLVVDGECGAATAVRSPYRIAPRGSLQRVIARALIFVT